MTTEYPSNYSSPQKVQYNGGLTAQPGQYNSTGRVGSTYGTPGVRTTGTVQGYPSGTQGTIRTTQPAIGANSYRPATQGYQTGISRGTIGQGYQTTGVTQGTIGQGYQTTGNYTVGTTQAYRPTTTAQAGYSRGQAIQSYPQTGIVSQTVGTQQIARSSYTGYGGDYIGASTIQTPHRQTQTYQPGRTIATPARTTQGYQNYATPGRVVNRGTLPTTQYASHTQIPQAQIQPQVRYQPQAQGQVRYQPQIQTPSLQPQTRTNQYVNNLPPRILTDQNEIEALKRELALYKSYHTAEEQKEIESQLKPSTEEPKKKRGRSKSRGRKSKKGADGETPSKKGGRSKSRTRDSKAKGGASSKGKRSKSKKRSRSKPKTAAA